MSDIYNLYKTMEREDVILSFKGDITQELLSSIYQIMESRMDSNNEDPRRKKKIYNILVECLQNVYHHMENFKQEASTETDVNATAIFMIGQNNDSYRIITGNYISVNKIEDLKQRIDKINAMNAEQLRAYYVEKLSTSELSAKGGAGLGIIDIARKSGQQMAYEFHQINEAYAFFSLTVFVK
ncbi:MAG: SiaB family protein kinase [Bacteroidia bacterium]|nr:SiaB family protein kinase [Bacteroidia bacterium]